MCLRCPVGTMCRRIRIPIFLDICLNAFISGSTCKVLMNSLLSRTGNIGPAREHVLCKEVCVWAFCLLRCCVF